MNKLVLLSPSLSQAIPEAAPDITLGLVDTNNTSESYLQQNALFVLDGRDLSEQEKNFINQLGKAESYCILVIAQWQSIGWLESNAGYVHFDFFTDTRMDLLVERINLRAHQQQALSQFQEMQDQLMQSEKMAALGQLAAGVAHEINNPVGFVSSNMNLLNRYVDRLLKSEQALQQKLQEDASGVATEKYAEWKNNSNFEGFFNDITEVVSESKEGLSRIIEIVKDLKEYSHLGSQQFEQIDLHKLVQSNINLLRNEIKYKAEVEIIAEPIPTVEAVGSQLSQVFVNIIVNACQAMKDFGVIRIGLTRREDNVEVSIADTGMGIAPEKLKEIFEPFYTTKPVGKGTGIGLAITKSIVERHHGVIEVESTLGEGTTFYILLPIQQPEVALEEH
ncbi:sensor histidine kinase [Reinekea thalattae]|uniref:histidine kinase n=1 Tax=Reinekea thalattae TaxID=2593301 RepID=A0A5C8Z8U1_9GAMM|nr:ATP-binding protein [Reinekea thalattae]TXR54097.1 hypothetical protein FME95_06045 [Reinekea thalattae]